MNTKKRNKRINAGEPGGKTIPRAEVDAQKQRPHISLEHLQASYGIAACDKDEKAAFAERLCELSSLTWDALQRASRHKQGFETIPPDAIRASIPPCVGSSRLLAFRFSSLKPMVGFRDGRVFHVLWLDRNFSLYDHG